jgi:hypothetical protein
VLFPDAVDPEVAAGQLYDSLKPHYPDLKREDITSTPQVDGRTVKVWSERGDLLLKVKSKNARVDVELPAQADGTIAPQGKEAIRGLLNRYPNLDVAVGITNPQNRSIDLDAEGFPELRGLTGGKPRLIPHDTAPSNLP